MDRAFFRIREVAEVLGIGKSLAYELVASGKIPSVWIAGTRSRRVPAAALQSWIDEQNRIAIERSQQGESS